MLFILLILVFLAPALLVHPLDPAAFNDDVLGLIAFKAGLLDPQSKLSSWNGDDYTPCNWVGVKCDPFSSRVTHLLLDNFSLSGHIGRSLLRLDYLQVLSFSNNNFTGNINPVVAQIQSLSVVDLSQNSFSGYIPDQLFRQCCSSLRSVSLANNNLTGLIPDSLRSCPTLHKLNFSSNQLSGQLPYGLWSLTSLQSLDLSQNLLEGEIPGDIGNLYDLRDVNLSRNKFTGMLPHEIGNCLLLKSVDFGDNALSGWLPESLQKLTLCASLSLRGNSFEWELPHWVDGMKSLEILDLSANNFSGRIPNSLGNFQFLKEINLSQNQFTGSLPDALRNCINLKVMDIGHNLLTGQLPPWIFEMGLTSISLSGNNFSGSIQYPPLMSMTASFQQLQLLDLSSNALSGEISPVTGNFSRLLVLNLSRNFLVGHLPASIGQLNTTIVFDSSHNKLNGSIPSEIGGAISLQELRLGSNCLTGTIPADLQDCSSLIILDLSQNNLTGPIPAAIANVTNLQTVDLSLNHFSGSLPKELTSLSHLTAFNMSHNNLEGELPVDGFFNTIPASSVTGNPSLCGSIVNHSCPGVHPKPIVLNPNSSDSNHGGLSSNFRHKRIILSISSLVAIGAAVFIALGVVIVSILNMHVRSSMMRSATTLALSGRDDFSQSHGTEANYGKLVMFTENADFAAGTQALLDKDCELGRGGFGAVYRTELRDGRTVAIKKLNVSSLIKGQEEFEKEVRALGKIRHQNLVNLEGYYWTPSLQLLINEYVGGGSLYKHLHEMQSESCLSWEDRYNIILGTAKGLAKLHQLNIVHYNIKSNNVLLDSCGGPKVADFGLARLLPTLDRYILSSKIQSALGYMAPEFACQTVKITEKCDVYGFGVLTLEVVTGNRPVEYMEDDVIVLCDMVRGELEEGRVEQCVDSKLQGKFPVEEVIPVMKLGLICASQVPSNRPDMDEVIRILELIRCPSEGQEELE